MRLLPALLLVPAIALGQASTDTAAAATPAKAEIKNLLVIPSGTKVPVVLQHAISTKHAREGDPAQAIIDVADEQDADLIVVGARGSTGLRRFMLGSVSSKLAHHAPSSVLIVRQD